MKLKLEKIEELITDLKSYTNSSIKIVKLETVQHTSSIIANMISGLVVGMVIFLFVLFLSLGISIFLSNLFDSYYLGYGSVAGVYLLVGIVFIVGRKKILFNPIRNKIIHSIFQNHVNNE
ncbi:MAG: phage holin family protein [Bacteroidales bacterium]|nr:phage holin family protein [Bacteroidales bacterium]